MKVDFHVHTNFSFDSTIKVQELMLKAEKLGIIPVISDHNTTAACNEAIPAEEIRTLSGDLIGLYLTEEISPKLSFEETIDRIKEQGGLAYLPHMYDMGRHGCGDEYAGLVDIIEIFNARCLDNKLNEMAAETARELNKAGAAGSDSHFLFEFGRTYTELPEFDIENPNELLKALTSGKSRIICRKAPFYVRGPTTVVKFGRRLRKKLKI